MLPQDFSDTVHFELLHPIAQGGMGEVYAAVQSGAESFRKRVALKFIRGEHAQHDAFNRNFIGEARLVADLIHANVVQIYHLGNFNGVVYFVMEYVDGPNLETFILQHRALRREVSPRLAAFIISRVCRGLDYAHRKLSPEGQPMGIVHRDVNPKNVMLSFAGDVKLTDFGIAKAIDLMYNREGEVIAGKDEYLSPEQARKEVTDARADVFSCGVMLAEMLLGANPFDAGRPVATRRNICSMPTPRFFDLKPDLPEELVAIVQRALMKNRRHRFQSAGEMMSALEYFLYRKGYGPTSEKLASYLSDLFWDGLAFNDNRKQPALPIRSPRPAPTSAAN